MLDLNLDDQQQQLVRSLAGFCEGRVPPMPTSQDADPRVFPAELWKGLAELGALALAHPQSGAGRLDVVASMEALGAVAAPGPLVATHLAAAALPDARADAVADGSAVATLGSEGWYPWGGHAQHLVEIDLDQLWLVEGAPATTVDTLAREPWCRIDGRRALALERSREGIEVAHLALAAYLVGAAGRVVDLAAGHARDRRQFGRSIGEFQAVAHPLARVHLDVLGARDLTRVVAHRVDAGIEVGAGAAMARIAASRAALDAAHLAHQVHGAVGYTEESALPTFTRQIRQWAGGPPSLAGARRLVAAATLNSVG